jgi:hypothetical protein
MNGPEFFQEQPMPNKRFFPGIGISKFWLTNQY